MWAHSFIYLISSATAHRRPFPIQINDSFTINEWNDVLPNFCYFSASFPNHTTDELIWNRHLLLDVIRLLILLLSVISGAKLTPCNGC